MGHKRTSRRLHFVPASALAAWFYFLRVLSGWTASPQDEAARGLHLARAALELGRDDPVALSLAGWIVATLGHDVEAGVAAAEQEHLSPNSAQVVDMSGYLLTLAGNQETALERFATALRLSPGDPVSYRFNTGAGIACLLMGRYDDAVAFCEKARRSHGKWGPIFRILAAGYAHLGQTQKASEALVRYRELEPSASIAHLHRQLPYIAMSNRPSASGRGCARRAYGTERKVLADHHATGQVSRIAGLPVAKSKCPLSGVKRTSRFQGAMSAFDPKRT